MDGSSLAVEELRFVVDHASREELQLRQADLSMKRHRRSEPVGVQGMILDAMDDGRIDVKDAYRLLMAVQARLSGKSPGLSRVTEAGELVQVGPITVEGDDGR